MKIISTDYPYLKVKFRFQDAEKKYEERLYIDTGFRLNSPSSILLLSLSIKYKSEFDEYRKKFPQKIYEQNFLLADGSLKEKIPYCIGRVEINGVERMSYIFNDFGADESYIGRIDEFIVIFEKGRKIWIIQ